MSGFHVFGSQMGLANVLILFYGLAMAIETLGQAHSSRWKVTVFCAGCDIRERVDLRALLWTRGRDFPLEMLPGRLRCPRCGALSPRVTWSVPGDGKPESKDLLEVPGRYLIEQLDLRGRVVDTLERGRFEAAVRCFKKEVERKPGCRFVMRDGSRIVRQWPERET